MKKVLHISKYYSPFIGGVEQIARDCVLSLDGQVEQKVICFDHEYRASDRADLVDGVEVIRCSQQIMIASQSMGITYAKQLKKILNDFHPDIVIFHYPNPFVSHFLLKYIHDDTKLVVYWHLDIIKQKVLKHFFYFQNVRLLKKANKIVATSPNYIEGSYWLSRFKEKCVVIPNCINENRLKVTEKEKKLALKIKEESNGKIICLAVGRHVPYKGFEYLIKASKLLDEKFEIRITGKGPLTKKLKELASDDTKVKFLGLVSDEELKANLLACDIYCFPSITKNEAFGVALAEGMYFGNPAVTFTIPGSGVNYVSLNNITGIEVENKNVVAYAAALKKIANDTKICKIYGEAAHERVVNDFMFNSFKKKIQELIRFLN